MAFATWVLGSVFFGGLFLRAEVRWQAARRAARADEPAGLPEVVWAVGEEARALGRHQPGTELERRRRAVLWSLAVFMLFSLLGYPLATILLNMF